MVKNPPLPTINFQKNYPNKTRFHHDFTMKVFHNDRIHSANRSRKLAFELTAQNQLTMDMMYGLLDYGYAVHSWQFHSISTGYSNITSHSSRYQAFSVIR